jgi:nucleoside 2-deoxyribosyltransferase
MKHYVYLAGPITDLSFQGASDWREAVAAQLDSDRIETLTPLRGNEFLRHEKKLTNGEYPNALTTVKGINRRDMFDTSRSSAVLVNLLGTQKISVGTVMEIGWAFMARVPSVVVMEKDNIHRHAMVEDCATYIVETIEEAVQIVKILLNDHKKS